MWGPEAAAVYTRGLRSTSGATTAAIQQAEKAGLAYGRRCCHGKGTNSANVALAQNSCARQISQFCACRRLSTVSAEAADYLPGGSSPAEVNSQLRLSRVLWPFWWGAGLVVGSQHTRSDSPHQGRTACRLLVRFQSLLMPRPPTRILEPAGGRSGVQWYFRI